jgi:superoxide dismutase
LVLKSQGGGEGGKLANGALFSAIQNEFGIMNHFIGKFNAVAAGSANLG